LDTQKDSCVDGFSHDIPKSVLESRKMRAAAIVAANKAAKTTTLKRPA